MSAYLRRVGRIFDRVSSVRVAIYVACGAFAFFVIPDQALELYVIYAQALTSTLTGGTGSSAVQSSDYYLVLQLAFGMAATVSLCAVMGLCALRLLLVAQKPPHEQSTPGISNELIATSVGLSPAIALIIGFKSARLGEGARDLPDLAVEQYWLTVAATVLVILILLSVLAYRLLLRQRVIKIIDALFSLWGFVAVCILLLLFTASIVLNPVPLPSTLGSLALVALFLAVLAYLVTAFASVTVRYRFPMIPALVLLALAFAVFGLNDNHRVGFQIRHQGSSSLNLETSFIEWFKQRSDREHFASKGVPYPVYLVTAEGGGIYAAYSVASFLARMQDECPTFAQHTFGISSVSGGSLGAAVFSALASERAKNAAWEPCRQPDQDGEFQRVVRRYFQHDLLSPLVAAALFPDFLQRFLPVALPQLDRARALERAFEHAWDDAVTSSNAEARPELLAQPLEALWASGKSSPLLFLNTTAITTGARVTISGIYFDVSPTAFHVSESLLNGCPGGVRPISMPISTAVSLSARAPWVTPVGWLQRPKSCPSAYGDRLYLADGGYFENSGLETAIELAARLRRVIDFHRDVFPSGAKTVEITIINILTADSFAKRWWSIDADLSTSSYGELLSPIATLLNTTRARTRAVDSRTAFDKSYYLDGQYAEPFAIRPADPAFTRLDFIPGYYRVVIDGTRFFVPLGWHLSAQTRQQVDRQRSKLQDASRCLVRNDLAGLAAPEWAKRVQNCVRDTW